ncbi:hypothetical protein BE61_40180 [Bradyrhizobium elkanii USDA 61]|jgi:hypothetical protein|nr:hypothetical protein XI02_30255 [Bradyrhizobium sp. CCBAU 21365]BBB98578.1 hypothetical protein BE61_40180 [Bradyrhizobium elkanii USDA 61]
MMPNSYQVSALLFDWEKMVPALMIAAGLALVLIGSIAAARHKRSEKTWEDGEAAAPRPRMAPLPRLLSTQRDRGE